MYATRWIEVDVSLYHSRAARRKSEDISLDKFDMALCNYSTEPAIFSSVISWSAIHSQGCRLPEHEESSSQLKSTHRLPTDHLELSVYRPPDLALPSEMLGMRRCSASTRN